jgi:hypothetical protein
MAPETKADRLVRIHAEAKKQFTRIYDAIREERKLCKEDRRFYSIQGAQWEGSLGNQFENKPKFEVNKIHLAVIRIFNEYRNNRISVDFVSKEGVEHDALADACDGLFRADEADSGAEEAYDNAFEEAVGGGFGALRLRPCYEDEEDPENEKQRIRIEPIFDADQSVFFDLDAKRQDKADAKHCFVLYSMDRASYEDEYEDDPASWPTSTEGDTFDWTTPDVVIVAEYYCLEQKNDRAYIYKSLTGEEERHLKSELDADPGLEKQLDATGWRKIREKRVKHTRVHKYLLNGDHVIEDQGLLAGKAIPIVPAYGKRWFVDNVERCMGHVRLAKDAQRLKNMQLSRLGEISALSTIEKPIFTPEQMAGHQNMWAEDNIKNYPYLLVNPITDATGQPMPAGPVAFTKPPEIPQALAALLQLTEQDMQQILGSQGEGDKIVSNIADKTVERIQDRLDMQTYIYLSNFAKCIRRVGEIWLGMAREVYVESDRKMKTIGNMGELGTVELGRPAIDPKSGAAITENDLSSAVFDVAVDVGPASASQRRSLVRSLTGMLQIVQDPATSEVLQSLVMMNLEGEGIIEVREYFRKKLVRSGVLKPTEEDAKEMAAMAGQEDPQSVALRAMADEATAKATKARADVAKVASEISLNNAKTIETLASVDSDGAAPAPAQRNRTAAPAYRPEAAPAPVAMPALTLHIHNDGGKVTRIQRIERGPDGEMISAEIVKGDGNGE